MKTKKVLYISNGYIRMGILSVEICLLLWVFTGVVFAKTVYVPVSYTHLTLPTNREV